MTNGPSDLSTELMEKIALEHGIRATFCLITLDKRFIIEFPGPISVNLSTLPSIYKGYKVEYRIVPIARIRSKQDSFLKSHGLI